jgi:FKBP-type peptidyl-prolyl cis-trans isomerase FkpA
MTITDFFNEMTNIMEKIIQRIFFLVLTTACIGCENADYIRNEDGLIYRIINAGEGEKITHKTYLKIHQSMEVGDSVFYSTFGKIPSYGLFDSLPNPTHDFLDIIDQMRVGDSAIIIRSVDTLSKRGALQLNDVFRKGGKMKVKIKILALYDTEDQLQEDRQREFEAYKKREIEELATWLEKQNIKGFRKAPEGVFIKTENEGSGIKVDSTMQVTVNYTGSLLNGTVFDSNVDSTFEHVEPFKFAVGLRQVIEGWDIALKNMKVGEKAKIYIPSLLAYGMQGSGSKIPPYSHLMFDVEVLAAEELKPE